jgi:hypothetical protein
MKIGKLKAGNSGSFSAAESGARAQVFELARLGLSETSNRSFNPMELWKFLEEALSNLTPDGLLDQLKLVQQRMVIYRGLAYTQLPVVTFMRETLELEGPAREKALRKLQILEQDLLRPLSNPRPMQRCWTSLRTPIPTMSA